MTGRALARWRQWLDTLGEHWVPELLCALLAAGAFGLGVVMLGAPDRFQRSPVFGPVHDLVPIWVWAILFLASSVGVIAGCVHARSAAIPGVVFLGAVFVIFALFQIFAVTKGAVPSGVVVYTMLGGICLVTSLACSAQGGERHPVPRPSS